MEEGKASQTAILGTIMRAAHFLLDDEPKVLRDEFALELSGFKSSAELQAAMEGMIARASKYTTAEFAQCFVRYLRAEVAQRNRYAEDELAKAIRCGVKQYIILGAGLDSFAYRNQALANSIQIFEVDHPATQQWKLERLNAINVEIPDNVMFVPVDFERKTLLDGLQEGGYRSKIPGFFSWLAVVPYLSEDAIFGTLRDIASLAAGTEVVFEYAVPDSLLTEEDRRPGAVAKAIALEGGEPAFSFFHPSTLREKVQELGFDVIEDFGSEDANARYFSGRRDGLRAFPSFHLMKARVLRDAVY